MSVIIIFYVLHSCLLIRLNITVEIFWIDAVYLYIVNLLIVHYFLIFFSLFMLTSLLFIVLFILFHDPVSLLLILLKTLSLCISARRRCGI